MAEIDLIPGAYRALIKLRSWATRLGVAVGGLILASVAAYIILNQINNQIDVEVNELQARQEMTTRQRDELKQLDEEKTGYENQLALLKELRSGAATQEMFRTIDRALTDSDVWFLDWEFRRANSVVKKQDESVETGYFIIVKSGKDNKESETWKIETHMNIKGQAQDHSALSKFVRRLYEQPEIKDVRILNTTRSSQRKVVDFDLAVIVKTHRAS